MGARGGAARELSDWLRGQVDAGELDRPEDVPDQVREQLQALGYIGSGAAVEARYRR